MINIVRAFSLNSLGDFIYDMFTSPMYLVERCVQGLFLRKRIFTEKVLQKPNVCSIWHYFDQNTLLATLYFYNFTTVTLTVISGRTGSQLSVHWQNDGSEGPLASIKAYPPYIIIFKTYGKRKSPCQKTIFHILSYLADLNPKKNLRI